MEKKFKFCLSYIIVIESKPDISLMIWKNSREITRNAKLIIGMNGQTTTIKDPENPSAEPRKYAFDYSYWSHDAFKEGPGGYFEPAEPHYADQV